MAKETQKISEILLGEAPKPRRNQKTVEGLKVYHKQLERQPTPEEKRKKDMAKLERRLQTIRSVGQKLEKLRQMVDIRAEQRVLWNILLKIEPRFDKKNYDVKILYSILGWVWRIDSWNVLKLDYSKGLFLYGDIGRGKSMTLMLLRDYLKDVRTRHKEYCKSEYRFGTEWMSASMIANRYAADGLPGLDKLLKHDCCLFVDELGREPNPASNYGTKMNVLQFLMQIRYDNRYSCVTHATTNLPLCEIETVYGKYIADRFLEMFNFLEFKGKSLRRP